MSTYLCEFLVGGLRGLGFQVWAHPYNNNVVFNINCDSYHVRTSYGMQFIVKMGFITAGFWCTSDDGIPFSNFLVVDLRDPGVDVCDVLWSFVLVRLFCVDHIGCV